MRTERVNELKASMKSFGKEKYQKAELLDEMFALQQEIVSLTFNQDHAALAELKIWDVEKHLEQMNEELGNVADEELQRFIEGSKVLCNLIKAEISGKEFNRMLDDCRSNKLEIVLTKSIRRFGRDTVEILDALHQLKQLGVRVIFEQKELDTANTDSDLMISIIECLAQAENESRSENIKWGIKQRAMSGTSKLYDRKCYGYKHDKDGI